MRVVRPRRQRRVSTFAPRVIHSQALLSKALAAPTVAATGSDAMSRMPSLECPPPGSEAEMDEKKVLLLEMFSLSNLGCRMSRNHTLSDDRLEMKHEVRHHLARVLRSDLSPAGARAREHWLAAAKRRRKRWWRRQTWRS